MAALVRPAVLGDADGIGAVHVAGWRWAFADIVDAAYLAELQVTARADYWRGVLADPASQSAVFVADDGGEVVGVSACGPARDEDADQTTGEVYLLYLSQDRHGTGLGSALMTAALDSLRMRGFQVVTLWTLALNVIGRRFYDRTGWELDGATIQTIVGTQTMTDVRYRRSLTTRG